MNTKNNILKLALKRKSLTKFKRIEQQLSNSISIGSNILIKCFGTINFFEDDMALLSFVASNFDMSYESMK